MKRHEVMEIISRLRNGAPAIAGPGATSGILWGSGHDPMTIYNMEMGYATPMCVGIALARPELKVLALEGEGSTILGLPALATIGRYQPKNLVVVVFDNRVFGTGGGRIASATNHGVDIAGIASACGIENVISVDTLVDAERSLTAAFRSDGPWVVVATIEASDTRDRPRPGIDHVEAAYALRRGLGTPDQQ